MKFLEKSITIGDQTLTLQFGKLAQASHVAVYAKLGETSLLVTLNIGKAPDDIDYLPLQVEYVEKLYAGGRIKGSRWVKREGRPSDEAVLNARIIDRGIRPLFPKDLRKQIQIIATLLSVDNENSPEILAAIAASAVIHVSSLPWNGPLSTMRIGYKVEEGKGSYIVNPVEKDQKASSLDLVVTSGREKVVMIETQADQLPEAIILEGIKLAKAENVKVIEFIESIREEIGYPKEQAPSHEGEEVILKHLRDGYATQIEEIVKRRAQKESENKGELDEIIADFQDKHADLGADKKQLYQLVDLLSKKLMRERILKDKVRADGRAPEEIRPITVEVDTLQRTHGSALFQRGDTQVLSIATLGAPGLEQLIEGPEGEEAKHYMHHYHMPPYSVGECGRMGSTSRREIGHGALAEKAVEPVLPTQKEFPYAIRVVSEVLSSNGSTSMASTCASILCLMAAGVPIKTPVAGIAMGLFTSSDDEYVIISDLMGIEDFGGDMDFKLAGSADGVTAIQLDVKIDGLTDKMIAEIFEQAHRGRMHILSKMTAVIEKARSEVSMYAPKVTVLYPPADKIGEIIGPGGRNIKALIARTGAQIDIDNDGRVAISGTDKAQVAAAVEHIENMTKEIEVGTEYDGEVTRMMNFGAFVEVLPGREGLIHVSKMSKDYVKDPSEIMTEGQKVRVRVYEIDSQDRINLELLGEDGQPVVSHLDAPSRAPSGGGFGGGRGGDRGGSRGGFGGGSRGGFGGDRGPRRDGDRGGYQPRRTDDVLDELMP